MREFLHYYSVVGIEEEGEIVLYLYNAKDDSLSPIQTQIQIQTQIRNHSFLICR
jgi:hypothetical protein